MNQRSDSCQPVLEKCTRPNHPQSAPGSSRRPRPHQPIFQKPCKSPGNTLHWSLQSPFAPAALPQLDTLRPMNTVCPFYQCPSATPTAQSRSLPCLAASVRLPHSRQSPFSVRLRSSQIVSDRLRSSGIVRAHRRPPSAIPARLPNCSPDSASQTGKRARHFTLFRAKIRPPMPVRKEAFARHLEVVDTSKCWPTNVAIYNMPAFSANFGSPDSWRQDRCLSRPSELCQLLES